MRLILGLTLIELLIALAIVAIVAALTVPAFEQALENARLDAAARELTEGLKHARREALRSQKEAVFILDIGTGRFAIGEAAQSSTNSAGFEYEVMTAQSELIDATRAGIRFFPDGSSTGGTIRVRGGSRAWTIETDWLTGHVTVTR